MQHPPRVSIAYEQDRRRAGNKLFCPLHQPHPSVAEVTIPPYEHAARLLRLLKSKGLDTHLETGAAVIMTAKVLSVAGASYAGRSHVAEYLFYRLSGIPRASSAADKDQREAIAKFYAHWLAARAVDMLRHQKQK